jgi:hypothetical protein
MVLRVDLVAVVERLALVADLVVRRPHLRKDLLVVADTPERKIFRLVVVVAVVLLRQA